MFSTVKGSESAVSIEPAYTFPAADSDNKMLGFGWFKNGFSLEDNTTTCTFDSVYPVSGSVDLNGGTLYLLQDLIFKNVTTITGLGAIWGNHYFLDFCSSINQLPAEAAEFKDITLGLNADLVLTDTVTLKGSCKIIGNGWDIDLGASGCIIVDANAQAHFSNITIRGVTSENFIVTDDTSELILENAKWVQSDHYNFAQGNILFLNEVDLIGSYTFHYDSNLTSTIDYHTVLSITEGMIFKAGKKSSINDVDPLYFEDETSVLKFDSCSFIVTSSGMCLTRGKIELDRNVDLEIVGTTTSTGLVLGSGVESEDIILHLSSGACLSFRSGQLVYNNYKSDRLEALSETARVVRYGDSKIHVARDWVFPSMFVRVASGIPETTFAEGAISTYENAKLQLGPFEYDFSGDQSGYHFLRGNDFINLSKGVFPYPLFVVGSGNNIYGNGNIGGPVSLQNSGAELSFNLNGLVVNDVALSGGKVTLGRDLELGADAVFTSSGTVDLSMYNFNIGGLDSSWTSTILWQNSGGGISLNSRVCLLGQWEFDNSCIITGNGHTISMDGAGHIIVKDGVCLTLRDIVLHTVSQNDIQLETDDSCIILDNVIWLQDSDVMFDTGSITFLNDVDFRGSYSFVYDSFRTSTIAANSKWKITKEMALRIGKKENEGSVEPLYFENNASTLRLDDCTFIVTGSGMQILRGKVEMNGEVNMDVVGTTTSNGLILGSGVEAEDAKIKVFPGAALSFRTGMLTYNNTNPNGIVALSESARFICYGPSKTHIARDCTFPEMVLRLTNGVAETTLSEGVDFAYNNTHMVLDIVEFDFTGKQYCTTVFNLEGGCLLYLTKGNFILPIVVAGPYNYIWGTGNISGPITLYDSGTYLTCDLTGLFWGGITLNDSVLELGGDLTLGGDCTIDGDGQVCLMRYNVILGGQDSIWTSTLDWHSNGQFVCPYGFPRGIDLNSKMSLSGKWNIQDECMINGNGHMLDLGENGAIEVQEGVELTIRNAILHTAGENNIYCLEDNCSIVLDNVTWVQDSHTTFTKGSIRFENEVDFIGSYSFVYESSQTSTIVSNSHWTITDGMCLRIGRKEAENCVEPLYFEDSSSVWRFDNGSLIVTGSGIQILRGTTEMYGDVILDIMGTTTSNGLTIGSGVLAEDAIVKVFPSAAVYFRTGILVYKNATPDKIIALSESARFICYGPSITHISTNCTFPEMILKMTAGIPETIIEDGASFNYNNTHFILFNSAFNFTGKQYVTTMFNLEGDDLLFMSKGNFILPIAVAGSGNQVWGTGNIAAPIFMQDSDAEVTFDLNGNIETSVTMNGGKIILNKDIKLTRGVLFAGQGKVDLTGCKLSLGHDDLTWTGDILWDGGTEGSIDIRSKIDLLGTWTFSGESIIDGHGNAIDLSSNGNIVLDEGAKIILRDVKVSGISGNNVRCLDDDGVIILDDVTWIQDGNYSFTTGALKIKNNVKIEGPYEFVYESQKTSTILQDSHLKFGIGSTFDYNPTAGAKDLIEFYDDTSYLYFHSAYLHTNTTGMNIEKGNLVAKGSCDFSSDILLLDDDTIVSEGITIGSGSESDDCVLKIALGSILNVSAGTLTYNNVSALSLIMESQVSTLKILSGAEFILSQDLNLVDGRLSICEGAFIDLADGKNVVGSISFIE